MSVASQAAVVSAQPSAGLHWSAGGRYGLLGAALAFVALPLYVVLPGHYASQFGVSLSALGAVLLAARLLDAVVDPWLGRWIDSVLARSRAAGLQLACVSSLVLGTGFFALFYPPNLSSSSMLLWCAATLVVTYLGYSTLSVLHQAWGARLGGDASFRARVVSWREGLALLGVLLASALPSLLGLAATSLALVLLLATGVLGLSQAPFRAGTSIGNGPGDWRLPWRNADFRTLLALYMANGIASAIPATLVLFYIRDRLQAGHLEAAFLGLYFASAAVSFTAWLRLIERFGLSACWLSGMVLAIAGFGWAGWLGPGDSTLFGCVCVVSGIALGADLAAPNAMLTGVIQRAGHGRSQEGRYVGWWTAATKLNLALAAGLALPALAQLGYHPGTRDPQALLALTWAYCAIPCLLKLLAAAGLWHWWRRSSPD